MRTRRGFWKGLKNIATPDQIKTVRGLIEQTISPIDTRFPGTVAWYQACYHPPTLAELILSAIDATLNNSGVEAVAINGRYYDYSNPGESYAPTVFLRGGIFWVATLGDLVERLGGIK